jgi:hypothetical protein
MKPTFTSNRVKPITQLHAGSYVAEPSFPTTEAFNILIEQYASNYGPQPRLNTQLHQVEYPEVLLTSGKGVPAEFLSYNVAMQANRPHVMARQMSMMAPEQINLGTVRSGAAPLLTTPWTECPIAMGRW